MHSGKFINESSGTEYVVLSNIEELYMAVRSCHQEGRLFSGRSGYPNINYAALTQYLPFDFVLVRGLFFRIGMSPLTLLNKSKDELQKLFDNNPNPILCTQITPDQLDNEGIKYLCQFNQTIVHSITLYSPRHFEKHLNERNLHMPRCNDRKTVHESSLDYAEIKKFIDKYSQLTPLPTFNVIQTNDLPSIFEAARLGQLGEPLWKSPALKNESEAQKQAQTLQKPPHLG